MSYTYKDAIETAYKYLNLDKDKVKIIENTNKRGIIYEFNGIKTVVFIYPISCKQNNKQNFFDTRDSGAKERATAWRYAKENDLRYFCLGFNEEQERYREYVLSLESDEDSISNVSFRRARDTQVTGTQVNIPNDFIPYKDFERIKTPKGFYISAIHKEYIGEYIKLFDNRPYEVAGEKNIEIVDVKSEITYKTEVKKGSKRNRIIFGAPGTGKSFKLNGDKDDLLKEGGDYERVTFHSNYSYANFVGTYKPVVVKNTSGLVLDDEKKRIIEMLKDKTKTAQEKYDLLYDEFKDEGLTRLPILLGVYTDDDFKTRKADGTDTANDNSVERNHGRAIRQYLNLSDTLNDKKEIAYEYVPGPFMRVLVKALNSAMTDNPKPYLLIVEEINRANTAAVFGDVFQLLDRDSNGVSEYCISTTQDMRAYLAQELGVDESAVETIKIPNNMFIWATMNNADQGVYPMDTAFKRRWDFEYLGIDSKEEKVEKYVIPVGNSNNRKYVYWNELRKAINDKLSSDECRINEDKLLGPFFISKSVLEKALENEDAFVETFDSKVLMYLFEDAMKMNPKKIFRGHADKGGRMNFSRICEAFGESGIEIFGFSADMYVPKP